MLDADVGGAGLAEEVFVPEVAHDLLAPVHPSRTSGQECQNVELPGRQLHGRPLQAHLDAARFALEARTSGAAITDLGDALWWSAALHATVGSELYPIAVGGRV